MKKIIILISGLVFFAGQLFAQSLNKENDPDEQIIVNKEFDENGNLIQFDSTYVHQWSSTGDSALNFSFPNDEFFSGSGFPDIQQFFNGFHHDSLKSMLDIDEIMQNFQDQFGVGDSIWGRSLERFQSLEQRKEWHDLMKKHRQEIDDFWRGWDDKQEGSSGFKK